MDGLAARGIDVAERLRISTRAHLVLAYHKLEDQLGERAAADSARIGTTARGIGPCYADKMRRTTAVRFADLIDDGSTLQIGIGTIPDSVLACLDDRRDLGVHTEMFSDGVVRLVDNGTITGARKTIQGVEIHPPGSGAILPSWTDIKVSMYHCNRCKSVEAVASWEETGPYRHKEHNVRVSVSWAMYVLGAEEEK